MKDKDLHKMAEAVARHVIMADDPCVALSDILKSLSKDDGIDGTGMLKIFSSALIFSAQMLDGAAQTSIGAVVSVLVFLYPDKSLDELAGIAADILRGEQRDPLQALRLVVVTHRG